MQVILSGHANDPPPPPRTSRFHHLLQEASTMQFPQQPLRSSNRGRGGWIRNQPGPKRNPGRSGAQRTAPCRVNSEGTREGKVKET